MSKDTQLVVLASYPKSGNTWLRIVLANLLRPEAAPISINDIDVGGFPISQREMFERLAPWPFHEITRSACDCLMPEMIADALDEVEQDVVYYKTHEPCLRNRDGEWLLPPERVRAVLYLVRNPLDVLPSYAAHFGMDIEQALQELLAGEPSRTRQTGRADRGTMPDRVSSWSGHVHSWLEQSHPYPLVWTSYEALAADPQRHFARLFKGAGLTFTDAELATAIEHARFDKLQEQERAQGFREQLQRSRQSFFRRGRPNSGAEELQSAHVEAVLGSLSGEVVYERLYGEHRPQRIRGTS